jgi:hypothetical protein
MFWYFAYTYFQNEHFFNSFIAKLKTLLSKVEDLRYRYKWEHIELKKPIFIIGPPPFWNDDSPADALPAFGNRDAKNLFRHV